MDKITREDVAQKEKELSRPRYYIWRMSTMKRMKAAKVADEVIADVFGITVEKLNWLLK